MLSRMWTARFLSALQSSPGHYASSLTFFSPSKQFSFTRRPVPALRRRSSHSLAQHPAGLSLLVPEGEHGEQLSALPAASLTLLPSVCLALLLPIPLPCSEAA